MAKQAFSQELRTWRVNLLIAVAALVVYLPPFIFPSDLVAGLGEEDSLVENLSALLMFAAAVMYLVLFIRTRNYFHLLFTLLFIFGAGEEISWGQRIFNFDTPELMMEKNVQQEFNFHNLESISSFDQNGPKEGWMRFVNFYVLAYLFCLAYGIVLPALQRLSGAFSRFLERIRFQVPPLSLGIFFILGIVLAKLLISPANPVIKDPGQAAYIDEVSEMYLTLIFLLISIGFVRRNRAVN
jgi:hypothetical protein